MPQPARSTTAPRTGFPAMRSRLRCLAWAAAALATAARLAAQEMRPSGGHAVLRGSPGGFCDACHRSHPGRPGQYSLRTDERERQPPAWLSVDAPGAGAVTESCLRCHFDEATRRHQLDAERLPQGSGRYLGPDLSDDHPLGAADAGRRLAPAVRPWQAPGAGAWARAGTIECTTCHDAHDPTMQVLSAAGQLDRCGSCHAPELAGLKAHSAVSCSDCHALHGARQAFLLRDAATEFLCARCHSAATAAEPGAWARASSARPLPRTLSPSHYPGAACENCHVIHR